jgi:uncharacterized surface protein with fasciclin (FAS1) repeats
MTQNDTHNELDVEIRPEEHEPGFTEDSVVMDESVDDVEFEELDWVGDEKKDKEKLKAILTYHVVSGKVMAKDVATLTSAKTVNGQSVTIDTKSGVKVNNATVVTADVAASNGVIHVIDTVLLPK